MPLEPGAHIGPYEIQEFLGAGGMGEVYKALDTRLSRLVALKVLPPDKVADPTHKNRFLLEAKAASALNHPNIVAIYDVGSVDGVDYMAMEFIEGEGLDEAIPRDGMRVPQFLRIAVQAADALARAHTAGIIHRDLKPANLMITPTGQVKLLDFGLAKLAMSTAAASQDTQAQTITSHTGESPVMGTTAYMSPEQTEGREVDARSDIFSFGSMMYEMATGQQAFAGASRIAILSAILRDNPQPAGKVRPDLPPELDRLITRCLRKDLDRRFQHMDDLKVALEELKEEAEASPQPAAAAEEVARPRQSRLWVWTSALVVAAIAGVAAWRLIPKSSGNENLLHPLPLTSYPGNEGMPSFSPDGSQVAFVWNGARQDNDNIYVKLVGPGEPIRLTSDPAQDTSPQWSPDGRTIAFLRRQEDGREAVMTIPALGGPERKIAVLATHGWGIPYPTLCWTPDSKKLVVSGALSMEQPNGLYLVSPSTGEVTPFVTPKPKTDGDIRPDFSPDGRTLAFIRVAGLNVGKLMLLHVSAKLEPQGEPEPLPQPNMNPYGFDWINRRELLINSGDSSGTSLFRVPITGVVAIKELPGIGTGVRQIALSPRTGRLVYGFFSQDTNIWRLDLADKAAAPEKFIASTFREVAPQYSPDGKRIAFHSNRGGSVQIYVSGADGSDPWVLTSMSGTTTGTPRWSPDGQRISFDSNTGGNWQIYTIPADGGEPRQLTNDGNNNIGSSWSRDGRWIYFGSRRSGRFEVWKMPSQGGEPKQVTRNGGIGGVESPDGSTLYFIREGGEGVWKMPVEGGPETQVMKTYRNNYAVGDAGLYYTVAPAPERPATIEYLDFATGATRTLAKLDKRPDVGMTLSPDKRYLLFTLVDFEGSDLMLAEGFR